MENENFVFFSSKYILDKIFWVSETFLNNAYLIFFMIKLVIGLKGGSRKWFWILQEKR